MATTAHCLTCFETLDAYFEKRKPLSLSEIESSYALYKSSLPDSSGTAAALKVPAISRLAASADSSESSSTASPSPAWSSSTPATSISSLSLGTTSAPLFVTWNTVSEENDEVSLRGCIGTFDSHVLSEGLPEYATISALHDSRFSRVSKGELPMLQAAVTLLTDFEEADDAYDWEVGTHGIKLSFTDRGHRYGATYLPDVAAEQGWTKDETLYSLIRKAGWNGGRSKWKTLDLKVTRYQGKKASVNYPEFKKWKDWLASKQ